MRIEPLGDRAWILRELDAKPSRVANAIRQAALPGITDVVPCFDTVGIYGASLDEGLLDSILPTDATADAESRLLTVLVCYEMGEDLDSVASTLGLTTGEVIELHTSVEFECFAIGFCPGFAYLEPLPESLRGVPRLASPRTRTVPGSVGLTGNQTAVYPLVRPGGWPIIGMTPLEVVNEREGYFPIEVGDRIRFRSIDVAEFETLRGSRL